MYFHTTVDDPNTHRSQRYVYTGVLVRTRTYTHGTRTTTCRNTCTITDAPTRSRHLQNTRRHVRTHRRTHTRTSHVSTYMCMCTCTDVPRHAPRMHTLIYAEGHKRAPLLIINVTKSAAFQL